MSVKLLTEHHLEFLVLKGVCKCSSESTIIKMQHWWKSHVANSPCVHVSFCMLAISFYFVNCVIIHVSCELFYDSSFGCMLTTYK